MQVHFQIRTWPLRRLHLLYFLLNPSQIRSSYIQGTLTSTAAMATKSGSSKRPMCPICSKPARICLCTRLKAPSLENSVAVTILQHSLEKKHPLNSTRIASLGLRNLTVVSVSDVNFEGRFVLDFSYPDSKTGSSHWDTNITDFGGKGNGKRKWDSVQWPIQCNGSEKGSHFVKLTERPEEKRTNLADSDEDFSKRNDFGCVTASNSESLITEYVSGPAFSPTEAVSGCSGDAVVAFTIEKYGAIASLCNQMQKQNKFDQLLASQIAGNDLGKGFSVVKFQRKQLHGIDEYEEFQEFEIKVPPGSVLLFPSERAVRIEAINFEVKNLILLDGTWAKAKRMYSENPWLKLLPHLKLDLDELSLYSEVRHQPKTDCLSTIESIVYALKALGEDPEKLDGLLEVFKSMVGDQRQCKDERLSKISVKPSQS
ncbi:uncharacterized protein LOC113772127 [Coffea eugenioides]|uniref:uncharacterized protein LOC113772127 n=1 Tax=Coffea eugenioides TaxID=49369 RepID=UPI000F6097E2|nr:uncharacterized protein LOC113772127 [Coffea eugenioides]